MSAKYFICRDCAFIGRGTVKMKGSKFVERLLYWTLLIPGPFYTLWRHMTKKRFCTKCQSADMINVDSPEGKILFEKQLSRVK